MIKHIVARHERMPESPWQPPLMEEKQVTWAAHESCSRNCSRSWTCFVRSTLAVFFSLSTHEQWNRPYSWRAFIAHSWRLGECNADLISCSPKTFLESVLLEQVTWAYAHSLNKLPENYSLSVHCPLMNHFWATHEFLVFEPAIQKDSKTIDFGWFSDLLILEPAETAPGTHSWSTHELLMNHSWDTHGHRSCGQHLSKNKRIWNGLVRNSSNWFIKERISANWEPMLNQDPNWNPRRRAWMCFL